MIHRIKLEHLVELMESENYRDRFVAEYIQLKQRHEKLKRFNTKIEAATRTQHLDNGVDEPLHDCPAGLLREQQAAMGEYLHLLEVRAVIEDIDLEDAIKYYIYKALKAESEYHGFTACEAGGAVEALPEEVMSLEDTLKTFEYCDMYCDGSEGVCSKCPNRNSEDSTECGGITPIIRSALYHLQKYAKRLRITDVRRYARNGVSPATRAVKGMRCIGR